MLTGAGTVWTRRYRITPAPARYGRAGTVSRQRRHSSGAPAAYHRRQPAISRLEPPVTELSSAFAFFLDKRPPAQRSGSSTGSWKRTEAQPGALSSGERVDSAHELTLGADLPHSERPLGYRLAGIVRFFRVASERFRPFWLIFAQNGCQWVTTAPADAIWPIFRHFWLIFALRVVSL